MLMGLSLVLSALLTKSIAMELRQVIKIANLIEKFRSGMAPLMYYLIKWLTRGAMGSLMLQVPISISSKLATLSIKV